MPPRKRRRRPVDDRPGPSRGSLRLALVLTVLVGVNLYVFLWRGGTSVPDVMDRAAMAGEEIPADEAPAESDGLATTPSEAPAQEVDEGRSARGQVESGDSLGGILRREGLDTAAADELIRALRPHMDFRAIRVGQTYRIHFDADGQVDGFEFEVSRTLTVKVERTGEGTLEGAKVEAQTDIRTHQMSGRIDSSLYASIKGAGEDTGLVAFFVDVFAYDLNFYTDTHPGDTFKLIVEKEYLGDEFLRYRRVIGAEYAGKAGTFRAFWWKAPDVDEGSYYNEEGLAIERSLLKTPLKFARISSRFNPRRMHPVLHVRRGHFGVDYAAPTGTPVWSAAHGKIIFRGWRGGGGNTVIVKHDNGLQTLYLHLSKFRRGQKVGQRVKAKTVIGYVGSTGMSTGPHLHFSVKQNGRYVDPLKMKMSRGEPVPKKWRAKFQEDTAAVVARLTEVELPRVAALADPRFPILAPVFD